MKGTESQNTLLRTQPRSLPVFGEAGDEDVFGLEAGGVASSSRTGAEEEDAIGCGAGAGDGTFECDGDVGDGSCAVGADTGGINGSACGEAEGGGQLEGEPAFEFG